MEMAVKNLIKIKWRSKLLYDWNYEIVTSLILLNVIWHFPIGVIVTLVTLPLVRP